MHDNKNLNRKNFLISFALLGALSTSPFAIFADEEVVKNDVSEKQTPPAPPATANPGYTINYNTVSIIEYIKFASKICNANFIFNEAELPFTVTIVSDAPITPENVMATLIQTLRIHGMMILEQGNNLVIHKSPTVRQPATLVFGDEKTDLKTPIVTRVFRLKNANVDSIAAIVRPMISEEALIEVSRETRQLILTDATMIVEKIAALIENLDSPHSLLEIRSYETRYNKPEYLIEIASRIMNPIAQGNSFILVPQTLANAIFIVSTPELNEKTVAVLNSLDTPPKKTILSERKIKSEDIFVIKLDHRSGEEILRSLKEIANNLQSSGILENDLIETIDTAKWIRETNSLMFVGSPESNIKIKEFVSSLDIGGTLAEGNNSFFVFKPLNRSIEEIQKSMQEMADNLTKTNGADESLIATIRSQKTNPLTHTLLYAGDPGTFVKVRELLTTVDTPLTKGSRQLSHSNFVVYKLQSASFNDIDASLKSFAKNLENSGLSEEDIIHTINSVQLIKETNSLVFVGPDDALRRIMEILPQLDAGAGQQSVPPSTQFLAYKPKVKKGELLVKSIKETADQLKHSLADPALLHSLESAKWVKYTNTLLFTGDPISLKKAEELLAGIDVVDPKATPKSSYFVYKLQNPRGDALEEDLENMAKNMKASGMKDSPIVKVIENMRYVKETNSLLLTGEGPAIEEVKDLIAKYDTPRPSSGPSYSNFFMYKPQNETAEKIEKSMKDIGTSLKKADLYDPDLLSAIFSMKYVDTTNSFVFTGTSDAVAKIQNLLKEIDVALPHAIHIGQTTFLLYKLKNASGPQITTALKSISHDLKKSGTTDLEFLTALNSLKYVRETNSLMFTGTEESLTKVQGLIEKFDITSLAGADRTIGKVSGSPTEFFIYKTQSIPGPEMETTLRDFGANLRSSGLSDPGLFDTIETMKYNEKTQSLVFTGDQKSLERVKDLLKEFDVTVGPLGGAESSIQTIDNTSFLVYKLEFHKGDEIQTALRQIAKDLTLSNASINQNLLNSINSVQWLEVTNSLLCSGDQETLKRLKELVKSLDVPLKQVFIEILVIETSLSNALTFGLEWGGKFKYKNKASGSFNNLNPNDSLASGTFPYQLSQINATRTPLPTDVPFAPDFELGVIGDIIKHNGQSFVSLGSLLNALESDGEATIVMTPKIIAQDSKTATIFSGQNIPFAGSFVTNASQNTLTTANLEYRDIGMNLSITPVLGNSEIITLDINLDNSAKDIASSGATINFGTNSGTAQGISTTRTTMNTTVHVPNNNFLILSGMVNNTSTRSKTGLPCLGGIPVLGSAFSTDNSVDSNKNVVIFLRPTIINSLEDMKNLNANQEDFFRNQAGTPTLEHHFDEAMESIKSPDDE